MSLKRRTSRRNGGTGAGRKAAALGLMLAIVPGCAIRQGVIAPSRPPKGRANDLLDVSAVAPRLDAERTSKLSAVPTAPAAPATAVAAGPRDASVARTASPTPEPPQLPGSSPPAGPGLPPPSTAPGIIPGATGTVAPFPGAGPMPALPAPGPGFGPMAPVAAGQPSAPGDAGTPPPEIPTLPRTPLPAGALSSSPSPAPSTLAGATPATIPVFGRPYPIDLPTALQLADGQNPEIAEARVAIMAAAAQQLAAYSIMLPTLNGGASYHGHAGNLQRSTGQILNVSSQSVVMGAGVRTTAAESISIPGVNILGALTDAIYNPLAAHQTLIGTEFNASSTANLVLLEVSRLYLDLLGSQAELANWRKSAEEADEIARTVIDYFLTGQGRKADADRADTERRLFQAEIIRAEEEVAVASARLSARLNLDAGVRLEIPLWQMEPLQLIDAAAPVEDLVQTAIRRNPIVAARAADVGSAEYRLKRELARPWLPTVWLAYSGDSFGGGSNIVTPNVGRFAGRSDFDARLFWTVLNGGFGNRARQKGQRAEVNQAIATRVRAINGVREAVTASRGEALAQRAMVETARVEVRSAEDGYREDRIHLRESLGRPIEALNSLMLLARARVNLIRAITRANQAQFGLWVALGSPPPLGPDADPNEAAAGPPPLPVPLNSPIASRPLPLIPVPCPGPPLLGK